MPGHKGGGMAGNALADFLGKTVFAADVTNVPGMDDLHQTYGVIKEAQEIAATTFGADYTYFLINGSSCGLQAMVMTVCNPRDSILVPRNMHRSILSGIILSGAVPVFFRPEYHREYNIPLGVTAESINRCLDRHPGVKAVMLVNPTYHGITSDISSIARIVHDRGIPLLVDEAHGPHLYFHRELPPTAMDCGADAVVQGTHKILSAFTQASMLHLKGRLINRQRLEATLRLLQSTSTSYLLLASLDAARAQMSTQGRELVQHALELAGYIRSECNKIRGLSSFGVEIIGKSGVSGLDPCKVTISVKNLEVTGLWVEQWLRANRNIQVEMSDVFNILLIVTSGNCQQEAIYLLQALREMSEMPDKNCSGTAWQSNLTDFNLLPDIPELLVSPREAFGSPVNVLPLENTVGRISTEIISCYPPGVPVICPGERITREVIEYLLTMRDLGIHFQGCADPALNTVRVMES